MGKLAGKLLATMRNQRWAEDWIAMSKYAGREVMRMGKGAESKPAPHETALQSCQQLFPVLDETGKVDWDNGLSKSRKQWRRANQACQIENSQIINHLGTRNVARDLNKMRQAVGDAELTYHGMSYGTRIGYTYAAMFPKKVRALVLDGNINPSGNFADLANSAVGADLALDFVNKHAPSVTEAFQRGDKILSRKPIDLTSGEQYTR